MWARMLESSVWLTTSKETRLAWVTMLLMKDADGVVRSGVPGIAHAAVLTIEETERAVKELSAPDKYTNTQEHEGRRIKRVADGWLVLNHEKYRTSADLRAKWRQQKANQRARASMNTGELEDAGDIEDAGEQWRKERVQAKIAAAEEREAVVREKFNPGADGGQKGGPVKGKTASQIVRERLKEQETVEGEGASGL